MNFVQIKEKIREINIKSKLSEFNKKASKKAKVALLVSAFGGAVLGYGTSGIVNNGEEINLNRETVKVLNSGNFPDYNRNFCIELSEAAAEISKEFKEESNGTSREYKINQGACSFIMETVAR